MAVSPAEIRAREFNTVKRGGYDQREVESFRTAAADALEGALQESTAMEARARAAVARLQEYAQQAAAPPSSESAAAAETSAPVVAVAEAETISRTLLLAQRTADTTVAEAEAEAVRLIESAKAESRQAGEAERVRVEGEVQALLARRDFLESDVDQLEAHLATERERIGAVMAELEALTTRVPNGLATARRPQLSASDHVDHSTPSGEGAGPDGEDREEEEEEEEADVAALIDQVAESAETTDVAGSAGDEHNLFSAGEPHETHEPR